MALLQQKYLNIFYFWVYLVKGFYILQMKLIICCLKKRIKFKHKTILKRNFI